MEKVDARTLDSKAQEIIRKKAVSAVIDLKMTRKAAADFFGVSTYSVIKWVKAYLAGGEKNLKAKQQGRPKTEGLLKPWQSAQIVWAITDKCPDQLKLPFMLWTRNAVRQLIKQRFNIDLSLATMSRLLKRWGFTPQKPIYRAIQRDPKKVTRWLLEEYPMIKMRSKKEKSEIHWGDEMGVRSDHTFGRSFSPKGQTPVFSKNNKRYKCNMISSISNSGNMRFMLYTDTLTVEVFLKFLTRLIAKSSKKIFLILDNLKVHHALKVQQWITKHKTQIELFFLPAYAPDFNPDELLNQDVKANACHNTLIYNEKELKASMRSYLYRLQKTPSKIRNFFKKSSVSYAA